RRATPPSASGPNWAGSPRYGTRRDAFDPIGRLGRGDASCRGRTRSRLPVPPRRHRAVGPPPRRGEDRVAFPREATLRTGCELDVYGRRTSAVERAPVLGVGLDEVMEHGAVDRVDED